MQDGLIATPRSEARTKFASLEVDNRFHLVTLPLVTSELRRRMTRRCRIRLLQRLPLSVEPSRKVRGSTFKFKWNEQNITLTLLLCYVTAKPTGGSDVTAGGANVSSELQRKRLKRHELEVRQSSQKMRDLSINIRMKEQLIRELVKSSRDAHVINEQYKEKLVAMEKVCYTLCLLHALSISQYASNYNFFALFKEKQSAKQELAGLQRAFMELEQREQQDKSAKEQLQR